LENFGVVRNEIRPDGVNWSHPSSLTSIRGKDYLLYAAGCVNAEIIRKEYREERKSKFLSLNLAEDPLESEDLWEKRPEIVARLAALLEKY